MTAHEKYVVLWWDDKGRMYTLADDPAEPGGGAKLARRSLDELGSDDAELVTDRPSAPVPGRRYVLTESDAKRVLGWDEL